MEKNTRQEIDQFLDCRTIAVAGASRNEKSFSASAIKHLQTLGYKTLLVNPNFTETNQERNEFKTLADLPEGISHLLVLTSQAQTISVIKKAIEKGIESIWIQQKSDTPEALEICRVHNIHLVTNHCIFMFTQPEGMHKCHYVIKKFFRSVPV